MAIRVVRLGTPRAADEGMRLGTVRRPPRGVPKTEFARRDFYDVWYPNLAPSDALLKQGLVAAGAGASEWKRFERAYLAEMRTPERRHDLALLAALSHGTNFSVGCYCEDASRCHRTLLRGLLRDAGAAMVDD